MSRKKRKGSKRDREVIEHRSREQRLKRMRTDVEFTLVLTICLVVMVILLFLRNFWATLIPSVTVPLALAGSFACDGGVPLFCVPWSWYMAVWAAVFGAFVGLSIRLVRERRRFEAQSRAS